MTFKDLFKGKRKFVSIPGLVIISTYLWPVLLGIGLAYLSMKYIPYSKVKYAAIGIVMLFCLPAQTGWVMGMTGQVDPEGQKEVAGTKTIDNTPTPTVFTPTPTPTPTQTLPTATPEPTATPLPTKKPIIVYPTATKAPVQNATVQPIAQPIQQAAPVQQNSGSNYSGGDKDCPDFATQAEAQSFFLSNGGPASDPHRLDADNDGVACENNP